MYGQSTCTWLLSVPPSLSPSRVMQLIKGKSSHRLMRDFRSIRKEFWGRHLWARGYFVASTGNVSDEVIAKYIELQGLPFLTKLPHSNFEPRRHLHGTFRAASLAPQCHRALLPIPTAKLAEVHGGHSKAIRYLHCLQPPRLRKLYHDLPTRCNVRYEMVGDRGTTDMYHFAIPSSRHAQVWGHVERRFLPGQICIIPWTRG